MVYGLGIPLNPKPIVRVYPPYLLQAEALNSKFVGSEGKRQ